MTPQYRVLHEKGELQRRADEMEKLSDPCRICPRECRAARRRGQCGACGATDVAFVARALLHFGEEPPISGTRGSGTIFFHGCALGCPFCQNHQISHGEPPEASRVTSRELARMMLDLQAAGAHNINWVTPTHVLPQALRALDLAASEGLRIPLVYNCSGFISMQALELLEGVVDVALPDIKWLSAESERACGLDGLYAPRIREVIERWFSMVGPLQTDDDGIAVSGLLVRHLVLPENLSDTDAALAFLEPILAAGAGISLMAQYHPPSGLHLPAPLDRTLLPEEYYGFAYDLRLMEPPVAFIQDLEAHGVYNPDFDADEPFGPPPAR